MKKIKDWIWDKLFLDFYLDPRYTFRFKLINLIAGHDLILTYLSILEVQLDSIPDEEFVKNHPSICWDAVSDIKEITTRLVDGHIRKV